MLKDYVLTESTRKELVSFVDEVFKTDFAKELHAKIDNVELSFYPEYKRIVFNERAFASVDVTKEPAFAVVDKFIFAKQHNLDRPAPKRRYHESRMRASTMSKYLQQIEKALQK